MQHVFYDYLFHVWYGTTILVCGGVESKARQKLLCVFQYDWPSEERVLHYIIALAVTAELLMLTNTDSQLQIPFLQVHELLICKPCILTLNNTISIRLVHWPILSMAIHPPDISILSPQFRKHFIRSRQFLPIPRIHRQQTATHGKLASPYSHQWVIIVLYKLMKQPL